MKRQNQTKMWNEWKERKVKREEKKRSRGKHR